jgi:putative flippase GtrA
MTALLHDPQERSRFFKFAIVGAIGAAIDFGVMNLLVVITGTPLVISGTISFVCAVISNFLWNRFWTYPESRSKHVIRQLVQFTVVNALGLGIRIPILKFVEPALDRLLNDAIHIPKFIALFISHNATLALAIVVVMFWNFFVNRYWTYNDID